MNNAKIDAEELKKKIESDSIPNHLWSLVLDCKRRRDAFWRHSRKLHLKNNLISIPMLILSTLTGLTSVAQLGMTTQYNNISTAQTQSTSSVDNGLPDGGGSGGGGGQGAVMTSNTSTLALSYIVTISGVVSATLTALQRFFRYAERSEHANVVGKSYARIARRIQNTMVLLESKVATIEGESFRKFIEDVQRDMDSLMQETQELPPELIKQKAFYKEMLRFVKSKKKKDKGATPSNGSVQNDNERISEQDDCERGTFTDLRTADIRDMARTGPAPPDPEVMREFTYKRKRLDELRREIQKMQSDMTNENYQPIYRIGIKRILETKKTEYERLKSDFVQYATDNNLSFEI